MAMQLENILEAKDRETIRWLYDHDLINFDHVEGLMEERSSRRVDPQEFEAKKEYRRWVISAIGALADSDLIELQDVSSSDLEQGLVTIQQASLFSQDYRKNVEITSDVEFEGHLPTNKVLLYTVLYNVVKNARHQKPRSFKINVTMSEYVGEVPETAYSPSGTSKEGRFLKIDVCDNGKGFGKADVGQLFDRPKSKIFGGFGLYYASKVCDVLGAHIAITSSRKGSTVSVYHPI